jgi:hypothetical protein
MQNKENQEIYQKIKGLYNSTKFKNQKDKEAFLKLAMTYVGVNEHNKPDENLRNLESRYVRGDAYFEHAYKDQGISDEGKTRIALLNEMFSEHYGKYKQRKSDERKTRIENAVKKSEWYKTYNPEVTTKLMPLAMAYSGRGPNGDKRYNPIEERYEAADQVAMKLGKLSEGEKKAAKDLYNMFKARDNKEYERTDRTRKMDARRDALRMQHANTMNYTLEGLVTKDIKNKPALESVVPQKRRKEGFLAYIGNQLKKPWGKVAATGVALATLGILYSQIKGCDKKGTVVVAPIEHRLEQAPKPDMEKILGEMQRPENERFTPDPFKPFYGPEKGTVAPQEGQATETKESVKEKERTRCIDWEKSKLEQGILAYKFDGNTFKAKVNKDLAEIMRKDPKVVLRFIGDNKLYETNNVGPNGEIEINGVTYKSGAQFGVIRKAEGNCGDYLASMRLGKQAEAQAAEKLKVVIAPETVKEKAKETLEATVQKEVQMKEERTAVTQAIQETKTTQEKITAEQYKDKVQETKQEIKIHYDQEKKKETLRELRGLKAEFEDIYQQLTKVEMQYSKMWGFKGKYDYMTNFEKKQATNLYDELKTAFKDNNADNMFLSMTLRDAKTVPKLVVEFSNKGEESRLEHMVESYDTNNPDKKITRFNFGDTEPGYGKKEKFGYEILVPLAGLTPEQKAKTATAKIFEKLQEMREKGDFNTYWFERDVKRNDSNAKAPIQGNIFVSKGTKKFIGAIFTPYNTEVHFVSDKRNAGVEDKIDNDNILIGEAYEEKGNGDGGDGGNGGGGSGGVGGGAM